MYRSTGREKQKSKGGRIGGAGMSLEIKVIEKKNEVKGKPRRLMIRMK